MSIVVTAANIGAVIDPAAGHITGVVLAAQASGQSARQFALCDGVTAANMNSGVRPASLYAVSIGDAAAFKGFGGAEIAYQTLMLLDMPPGMSATVATTNSP